LELYNIYIIVIITGLALDLVWETLPWPNTSLSILRMSFSGRLRAHLQQKSNNFVNNFATQVKYSLELCYLTHLINFQLH
jgi:hypothetical protein